MKFQQNAFLWLLAGCGAVALAGALVANQEPGGFFVAVRVVVCFASAYAAVRAYQTKREVWTWLLGANAALYNPFVLVHLTRNIWNLVDLAGIALLLAAGVALRVRAQLILRLPDGSFLVQTRRFYARDSSAPQWPDRTPPHRASSPARGRPLPSSPSGTHRCRIA